MTVRDPAPVEEPAADLGPAAQVVGEALALPEVRLLLSALAPGSAQAVYGVGGSVKTLLAAALHRARRRPSVYICSDLQSARWIENDLITWLGEDEVALFPPREFSPLGTIAQSGEIAAQRLFVLQALADGRPLFVVAPVEAAMGLVPSPGRLGRTSMVVAPGQAGQPRTLAEFLAAAGYENVPSVEHPGDFSLRGSIVDVFCPTEPEPLRIEFGDDAVASIRTFSPVTQKSQRPVAQARLGPAREWVVQADQARALAAVLRRELTGAVRNLERLGRRQAAEHLAAKLGEDLERLAAGDTLGDVDAYAAYLEPSRPVLLDYLPEDAAVFLDEPVRLQQAARSVGAEHGERLGALADSGALLPGQTATGTDYAGLCERAGRCSVVYLSQLLRREPSRELANIVSLRHRAIPSFNGQWKDFESELGRWRRAGDRVLILCASAEAARALARSLRDAGIGVAAGLAPERQPGQVVVGRGGLETGFELPGLRLHVITDAQIRGRAARRRRRRFTAGTPGEGAARALASYRDLEVGDYVVHVNHGIGVYQGLRTLEIDGVRRDYIFIKYAGEDRLYVPTDQVGLVQKYVGVEGQEPKVHRLAGSEWARAKARAKESLLKLAVDLIRLHARRQMQPGYAFPPDSAWQAEFEAGFPYEETPDQLTALEEIKRDMERPVPMDRLLCGDVGYGKTEVAVRAAFKAVMGGKQVAVLVPTTVLAQQHYHTFRERFAGYPVNIDLLSRFRSRARQEKTIRELKRGTVDIVIGTHRLLAPDVRFRELGLLIIDEEHRFGVGHKERLKELKTNVDVLVLTATPIPRTLNMAMVGLRDMSVIDTPPEDRFPVQTYVVEYDEDLVKDAVLREMARGGQVFYVHNRIGTIDAAASRLRELVPKARIAVAHGQMKEEALEKTMMDFLEGEYDILVSTTIIESGLDLPNVNTLIVEDADTLGLAQLYQLRGRVGRSNRVAYAYFTYRPGRVITEQAERRLEAIREFTELGSGYKIALRDLEIRGAGNLLGPEQHGFIASVGFELYTRLLEEAIRELKGESEPRRAETMVDVSVDAYLPDAYIPDARQKMEAYHRIAAVSDPAGVEELRAELEDRFGPLPEPVENLLLVAGVRVSAGRLGCQSVTADGAGGLLCRFEEIPAELRRVLEGLSGKYPGVTVRPAAGAVLVTFRPRRRASLGERTCRRSADNVALLKGLADFFAFVESRAGEPQAGRPSSSGATAAAGLEPDRGKRERERESSYVES